MTIKKKNIIAGSLFIVIFIALMLVASFFDLEISKFIVGSSLDKGAYYSNNHIGNIIEIIGSFPIFGALLFATLIQARNYYSRNDKLKYLAILFFVGTVIDITWFIKDSFKYCSRIYGFEHIYELDFMIFIFIAISIIISFLAHYLYRKVSLEKNNELRKVAYVIFATCAFHLLIELIKGPVGRMRFRGMNAIGDFSYYTPWYVISSAKELVTSSIIPRDAFKSFPSGHTYAGSMIYLINCLPFIFDKFNNKKSKNILLIISLIYVFLVGFYRIRVGAHFMSDVVFSSSLAFLLYHIFSYVFLIRNKRN